MKKFLLPSLVLMHLISIVIFMTFGSTHPFFDAYYYSSEKFFLCLFLISLFKIKKFSRRDKYFISVYIFVQMGLGLIYLINYFDKIENVYYISTFLACSIFLLTLLLFSCKENECGK